MGVGASGLRGNTSNKRQFYPSPPPQKKDWGGGQEGRRERWAVERTPSSLWTALQRMNLVLHLTLAPPDSFLATPFASQVPAAPLRRGVQARHPRGRQLPRQLAHHPGAAALAARAAGGGGVQQLGAGGFDRV